MPWFAGAMVNAILRRGAIIIKSSIAKVYGHLMAGSAQTRQKKFIRFDDRFERIEPVLDADFETIEAVPKSSQSQSGLPKQDRPVAGYAISDLSASRTVGVNKTGMSVFSKKLSRGRPDDSVAFYAFGACLVMLSFWVSGGYSLFRSLDLTPTGAVHTARGSAEIADASWRVVTANGRSALHVAGIVRNSGAVAVQTKPVSVTVKHADGTSKRYFIGQKGWQLAPGGEVAVSGRLDIAPAGIASVVIALTD